MQDKFKISDEARVVLGYLGITPPDDEEDEETPEEDEAEEKE